MKKISVVVCILLLLVSTNTLAGDIPEGIMLGNQKALFIGEITSIADETFIIKPSTIMMGSIEKSQIEIKKFDNYYGTDKKPEMGDYIVVVLLDDNRIDEGWVFKASSNDYEKLNLISEKNNMVGRYEEYINEGRYFEAQKKINEKIKEEEKDIELAESKVLEEDVFKLNEKSEDSRAVDNSKIIIGVSLIIIIIIFIFLKVV